MTKKTPELIIGILMHLLLPEEGGNGNLLFHYFVKESIKHSYHSWEKTPVFLPSVRDNGEIMGKRSGC